ncbi:MAG TPA: 50S ribosomal protein L11 [Candidatus Sulfotelmatobacter sp.]|jgi:large subunit ribosomal protein L11|nr:50S ribosomal protein L11 [Candidatus Sulfotelmatobacter sp.]
MAKKIKILIKIALPAGAATPAPPVGTALGPHGLNIMEFVKAYNDKTADLKGNIIPVVITVYEDRTFSFITKKPPVAEMIKKATGKAKGSQKPGREKIAVLTMDQARKIAEDKLEDLNTDDIEMGARVVAGTARSMGIIVE